MWNIEEDKEVQTLDGHTGDVYAIAVFDEGRKAISTSGDATAKVWDIEQGREIRTLQGFGGHLVSVSCDGRTSIMASGDEIRLWDTETGKEVRVFKEPTLIYPQDTITTAIAALDGGRQVLSACYSTTVDERRGAMLARNTQGEEETRAFETGKERIVGISAFDKGRRFVSASEDKTLKMWDVETGTVIATFRGEVGMKSCVVTSDGRTIAAVDSSGGLCFLRLETPDMPCPTDAKSATASPSLSLAEQNHLVHLKSETEALHLLASSVALEPDDLPPETEGILHECGCVPLAVALCAGMAAHGVDWSTILETVAARRHRQQRHEPYRQPRPRLRLQGRASQRGGPGSR